MSWLAIVGAEDPHSLFRRRPTMNHLRLQKNRELLTGKIVIGIDPAKDKHQAAIINPRGSQRGASFSFPVNAAGFGEILWRSIAKVLPSCTIQDVVFAVETACNLSLGDPRLLSLQSGLYRRPGLSLEHTPCPANPLHGVFTH